MHTCKLFYIDTFLSFQLTLFRHLAEPALFGKGKSADDYETGKFDP